MKHAYYITVTKDDGSVQVTSGAFASLNEANSAMKHARRPGVPKHRVRVLSASVLSEMGVPLRPELSSFHPKEEDV